MQFSSNMTEEVVAKILFAVFHFICLIVGSSMLGVGIWLHVDNQSLATAIKHGINDILEDKYLKAVLEDKYIKKELDNIVFELNTDISYPFIILGGITLAISVCGFCGASKGSKPLLLVYRALISSIVLSQICIFLFLIEGNFLHKNVKERLKNSATKSNTEGTAYAKLWDAANAGLQCCGVDSFQDFGYNSNATQSCCKLDMDVTLNVWMKILNRTIDANYVKDKNCLDWNQLSDENSYKDQGCYGKVIQYLTNEYLHLTITIFIGIIVYEITLFQKPRSDLPKPRYLMISPN